MTSISLQALKNMLKSWKGFDRVLHKVNIVSAENGKCLAEMKVEEENVNCLGGMHGGFSATLVDVFSSLALLTDKSGLCPSVSVNINITYLKGAAVGDEILIDAKTLKSGKNLAFLEVQIKNKISGDILVKGSHTKYILNQS